MLNPKLLHKLCLNFLRKIRHIRKYLFFFCKLFFSYYHKLRVFLNYQEKLFGKFSNLLSRKFDNFFRLFCCNNPFYRNRSGGLRFYFLHRMLDSLCHCCKFYKNINIKYSLDFILCHNNLNCIRNLVNFMIC